MATWDQRDKRWIVENRKDGKNVNNWHWTESDFTKWTEDWLKNEFENHKIENSDIECKISKVTQTGEVTMNTRKQKVILFYEIDVTLKWEGEFHGEKFYSGTVRMPYISEENDDDDFEIQYTVDSSEKEASNLKDAFRKEFTPKLKKKIPELLSTLRDLAQQKTQLQLKTSPSAKLLDKEDVDVSAILRQHDKEQEKKKRATNQRRGSEERRAQSTLPSPQNYP